MLAAYILNYQNPQDLRIFLNGVSHKSRAWQKLCYLAAYGRI
jgi:hypothetical protein